MTMQTVLKPTRGRALQTSVSTTAALVGPLTRNDLTFYCSSADMYIKFGAIDVVAATNSYDMFIPSGVSKDVFSGGAKYVSVVASASATAYINEWTSRAS